MELVKEDCHETEFGNIPTQWSYDRLEYHSKRGSGHTPDKKRPEYYDGSIVWVSLADSNKLDNGKLNSSLITISKLGIANSSAVLHPRGIVLLSRDAGVGKSAVADCDLCVSQHFITWQCNERTLHNWFLYYWLQFQKAEFERVAAGSTIKTIGLPYFKLYKLPLPPYKEQIVIATALSDTDALINSLEKLLVKKRNIKQGAMQKLLQRKESWEVKKLGEVLQIFKGKALSKGKLTENGRFRCILYGELFTTYKEVIHDVISSTNVAEGELSVDGDILFPGSTTTTGIDLAKASAITLNDVLLGGDIIILRRLKYNYNSIYLSYYLNQVKKNQIAQTTKGITIHHLYGKDLSGIEASFPEIEEQTKIAKVLSDMDAELEALERKLEKYRNIKAGMMQNLLIGKIRLV